MDMELCDSPEKCGTCLKVIRMIQNLKMEDFIKSNRWLSDVHCLSFEILTSPEFFQNGVLSSIEHIVFSIFNEAIRFQEEMENWNVGLHLCLKLPVELTYPKLELRLFIVGRMSDDALSQFNQISINYIPSIVGVEGEWSDLSNLSNQGLLDLMLMEDTKPLRLFNSSDLTEHQPFLGKEQQKELEFLHLSPFHTIDLMGIVNKNFHIQSFQNDSLSF